MVHSSSTYTSNSQVCIIAASGEAAEVNGGATANISGSYNVLTANAFHSATATYQTTDSSLRMTRRQSSTVGESNADNHLQNEPFSNAVTINASPISQIQEQP